MRFGNSGYEHHTQPDGKNHHGRAEIWLGQNKHHRHKSVQTGNEYVLHISDRHVPAGKKFGQDEHYNQLGEVGRLKRKEAEVKPEFRAMGNMSKDKKQKQDGAKQKEKKYEHSGFFQKADRKS